MLKKVFIFSLLTTAIIFSSEAFCGKGDHFSDAEKFEYYWGKYQVHLNKFQEQPNEETQKKTKAAF